MKVLFQSRVDLYNPRGGDTAQMEHTKNAIEKMDPDISIDISTQAKDPNVDKYDIVHLFNLDWIPETYVQAKWAKAHKRKVVLSAIHHSEKEVINFEDKAAYDIRRIYNLVFPWQSARDVGKNIYRSFFNSKKLYPTLIQLLEGIRSTQRKVLQLSDIVLVQTEVEAEDIKNDFGYKDFKWEKVVNGVDVNIFENANESEFNNYVNSESGINISKDKLILSVGRVEPRKNQLALIDAFNQLKSENKLNGYRLVFIGAYTKHSPEYVRKFNNLISVAENNSIIYTGQLPQSLVASAMSHNGIYVHTSWFETTGLVTIEAALAGMNVVATGERTKEYLENNAFYCLPESVESIKNAIIEAVNNPKDMADIRKKIRDEYTWENTAKQTINIYKQLIASGAADNATHLSSTNGEREANL